MVVIQFKSISDISDFKHECDCNEFYIERDTLSIVGSFTEEQLKMAGEKYDAVHTINTP